MASTLTNVSNITDSGTLELDGASYVTTAVVGGVTYLLVAGRDDAGVSVFSLAPDGGLNPVFDFVDNGLTNLSGAFALTSVAVGGTTYLYTAAIFDYGVSGFSLAANGVLTNVANVADNATLQLALTTDVETVVVGGTTYLFSGGANDGGVSVFSVGADGALTNVDNVIDDATSKIAGPQGMTTAVVGGTTYLFVTGYHDDGVGVFSVAANGDLTNVFNVQDAGLLELDGPVDVITAVVGGTTYLLVTAFDDDGISVFSVAANGALSNVFNQPDDGLLELDNAVGMSIAVLGGTTYLFVVGADDDGLSVFEVAANGALTNVANVTDTGDFELDRPIGVTTVVTNGQIHVIVASNFDDGVSTFIFDDGVNEQPALTANGNDPAFAEGGAAVDLFGAPAASTVEPGQSFTALILTVTNVTDGASEMLSFLGNDIALTDGNAVAGVTVSLVGTTATVTVTVPGAADAAALQALIDSLAYRNTSQDPTGADRVITITSLTDSGGTADGGDDTAALNIVSTVNVDPANDAAIISGDTAGDVTEAGAVDGGTPTAAGNLDATDADNTNDAWQAVAGSASQNGYGTYALNADGTWTYTLDNDNPSVQALNGADTLSDSFVTVTEDGTAQTVTITIHAQNDAATVTGDAAGSVTESGAAGAGGAIDGGDLDATELDDATDSWQAAAGATANGFGSYVLSASGMWTYTLDNANAAVQALNAAGTLTDMFTALTADGTAQVVTLTIHGANDAAIIAGATTGSVREAGGFNNTSPGTPTASGNLDAADVDDPDDAWTVVAAGTASIGGFGTYQATAEGRWTYTLDNANPAVQALATIVTDSFNVTTVDGTTQLVTITILPQNDSATITGDADGAVIEAGDAPGQPTDSGNLDAIEVDNPNDAWQLAAGAGALGYGTYQLTADGMWTFTLDDSNAAVQALNVGDRLFDAFTALTVDGTGREVSVAIHGRNDAAIITGDADGAVVAAGAQPGQPIDSGDLDAADVDNTPDTWQAVTAATTAGGYGTYQLTAAGVWTYTLDNDNAAVRALQAGEQLTDTFTALTVDGTERTVTVTIDGQDDPQGNPDPAVITGTPGPDSVTAPSGDALINALTGVDTLTFDFRLTEATVRHEGNRVVIDGPNSHTVVTGAERFVFTDGTVDNSDGDPLVDDLFYYSKYHDVWNAHADADTHYDSFGRHEHRDPNAFFSTDFYLAVSPEARAAGRNPLGHFDAIGWQAGHLPSLAFDPAAYLAANPDVAAAHVDPLRHYLQFGYQEGRAPAAPTQSINPDGFDFVYYFAHNPDVAAARIDPLQHFRTFGWKEGRDPNALFDTSGYLAAYADVKAAGINPLDHYNQFGWQEGRDPSVGFDTSGYLAAYPDVAAAHVNPLMHYLQYGVHEGRSAFADGVFG